MLRPHSFNERMEDGAVFRHGVFTPLCGDGVLLSLLDYGNRSCCSILGCLHPHLTESKSCSLSAADAREQSTMVAVLLLTHFNHLVCGHPLIFRGISGLWQVEAAIAAHRRWSQYLPDPTEEFLPCGRFLDESALAAVEHRAWDLVVGGAHPKDTRLRVDPVQAFPNSVATETGHIVIEQHQRDSPPMFLI